MPLVSVIIPTHNRRSMLERAIASVLSQSFEAWELIVIDDGSQDSTADYLLELSQNWPHTQRLFCLKQSNQGVSAARNRAAEAAQGDWLAFLDSDDEWLPDKLSRQVELMPSYRWIHGEEIWMRNGWRVPTQAKHAKSGGKIFTRCVDICCVSPSTTIVHAPLFRELGGFRNDFPVCEDYDLWVKIAVEHEAGFVQEPVLIKHGGHEDQLSRRFHSMDYYRAKTLASFFTDPRLTPEEIKHVAETALAKCEVLLKGYRKHGQDRSVGEVMSWRTQALSALTQLQSAHSAAETRPRSVDNLTL